MGIDRNIHGNMCSLRVIISMDLEIKDQVIQSYLFVPYLEVR